jgi:hypothetical protein
MNKTIWFIKDCPEYLFTLPPEKGFPFSHIIHLKHLLIKELKYYIGII